MGAVRHPHVEIPDLSNVIDSTCTVVDEHEVKAHEEREVITIEQEQTNN